MLMPGKRDQFKLILVSYSLKLYSLKSLGYTSRYIMFGIKAALINIFTFTNAPMIMC